MSCTAVSLPKSQLKFLRSLVIQLNQTVEICLNNKNALKGSSVSTELKRERILHERFFHGKFSRLGNRRWHAQPATSVTPLPTRGFPPRPNLT